ncbi:hypothetical protein DL95DRAFT_392966 [Leptodontidium sp. 2 PMI_412]|nr:hypothetical protein DL95DRAFT_392966 [Leptodontidium sp. 2 PMI_412]
MFLRSYYPQLSAGISMSFLIILLMFDLMSLLVLCQASRPLCFDLFCQVFGCVRFGFKVMSSCSTVFGVS